MTNSPRPGRPARRLLPKSYCIFHSYRRWVLELGAKAIKCSRFFLAVGCGGAVLAQKVFFRKCECG